MVKKLLITIDGPAGAGKSSVSKDLSQKLSYLYLDTGALYRAIAYKMIREKRNQEDRQFLIELSNSLDLHLAAKGSMLRVVLDHVDITDFLRTEEIGFLASEISTLPVIREMLLPIQRQFGSLGGIVAEGRDMGTVVFPSADLKFFLSASVSERARRRHRQLCESGIFSDLEAIKDRIILRDRQDMERAIAPLKVPADAVIIDSTALSFEEVVAVMMNTISPLLC